MKNDIFILLLWLIITILVKAIKAKGVTKTNFVCFEVVSRIKP